LADKLMPVLEEVGVTDMPEMYPAHRNARTP
jgi:hypothetical protein